jgi:hypothetical protein
VGHAVFVVVIAPGRKDRIDRSIGGPSSFRCISPSTPERVDAIIGWPSVSTARKKRCTGGGRPSTMCASYVAGWIGRRAESIREWSAIVPRCQLHRP